MSASPVPAGPSAPRAERGGDGRPGAARTKSLLIKSGGYGVSTLSVFLLAAPSWQNASKSPLLMACLVAGMAASIAGMGLRWLSYWREKRGR